MNNIIRSTPIAEQVNEILRERMRDGSYSPGACLPSESHLSTEFGVSRATIRTILARIEAEGLILRRQGDDTFINEHIQNVNTHLGGLWEFSRLIESSGFTPSIQPVSIEKRLPNSEEAQVLGTPSGEQVLAMGRLFYADQKPVIYAMNAFPDRLIDPTAGTPDGQLRIRDFLRRYCDFAWFRPGAEPYRASG